MELTDLSNDRDGSVVGWQEDGVYKVSTQVEGQEIIFNEDCKKMFADFLELKEIDFSMIDTTHVTDMSEMFADCVRLRALYLYTFDTSNVTDMSGMFAWCYDLKKIDISYFNTSKVKTMTWMFCGCRALKIPNFVSNRDN